MKNILKNAIISFLCFFICVLCSCNKEYKSEMNITYKVGEKEIRIALFDGQTEGNIFLPGDVSVEDISVRLKNDEYVCIDGEKIVDGDKLQDVDTTKMLKCEWYKQSGKKIATKKIKLVKGSNIPSVHIQLKDGEFEEIKSDKNIKKSGNIQVVSKKSLVYDGVFKSIKGRGNSSWLENKKSFSINFEQSVSFGTLGKAKEWVIIANACDTSNVRDKLVYDIAKSYGMEFSPVCELTDVYVNSEYQGMYLLTKKIVLDEDAINLNNLEKETQQLNERKLKDFEGKEEDIEGRYKKWMNISNDVDDVSGGYIVELTMSDRLYGIASAFSTKDGSLFKMTAPKYTSKKQIDYIADCFQKIENNLQQEEIDQLIDLESWKKYYLIQEGFANTELVSFFFYKDKDRNQVFAGPVWDFDMALGNCFGNENGVSAEVFYVNKWGWFEKLYKNPIFYQNIINEYNNNFQKILENKTLELLKQYEKTYSDSYRMNWIRWKDEGLSIWGGKNHESLSDAIQELKLFIKKRKQFLDSVWVDGKEPCRVYASSSVPVYFRFYTGVENLTTKEKLPLLSCEGYKFEGWYDEDNQVWYSDDLKIKQDMHFIAKWKKK